MSNVKKGILNPPPEWWKHLKWVKKVVWKRERQSYKKLIDQEKRRKE